MAEEVIGIRLRADGVVETTNGIVLTGVSFENLGKKAAAAAPQVQRVGVSAAQTSAAMRQLPSQITDIVTQLAGGQPVWQIAIQQGGQIKDSFGGIVPAARALVGAISPVGLALGAATAGAVGLVVAYEQGRRESEAYARALIMSGNAAGTNVGQLKDQARAISEVVGTQGKAAETLAALAGTGMVAANNLVSAGTLAVQMERTLGVSVEDTVKAFASLGREPLQASLRLNQGTNYLTASVYEQIRALMAQGKTVEAASVAQNAYTKAMSQRTAEVKENLGLLERSWRSVGAAAKWTWDRMLDVGRKQSLQESLAWVNDQLKKPTFSQKALLERKAALEEAIRFERQAAAQQAATAAQNQKDLEDQQEKHQAALAAGERAGAEKRLSAINLSLAMGRAAYESIWQRNEISAAEYQRAMLAIDTATVDAQIDNVNRLIAVERARKPKDDDERRQQSAAVVQLEARRNEVLQRRVDLLAQEARGERNIAPKPSQTDPRDALRAFKAQDEANVDAYVTERRLVAQEAARGLVQTNRDLSTSLIRDDRARGEAQIAQEETELRRRLDLYYLNAEDRKKVEEDLAQWRVLRERQLTESLKPEWQQMLEAWADTTRQMKVEWDNSMNLALRSGEDAFRQWARTGKLNIRDVFATLAAEAAASLFRKGAGGVFSWLTSGLLKGGSASNAASINAAATAEAGWFHSGGIAGGRPTFSRTMSASTWANAPRFHGGGLARDEVPAILKKKEGIFTEEQMKALAPVHAMSGKSVVYAPVTHYNIDARSDKDQIMALIAKGNQAALADFVDKMDRGQI